MAIQFLKATPEKAVEIIWECARKGYVIKHFILLDHNKVGVANVTDTMVADWIKQISDWSEETRESLLGIYTSSTYAYKFLETTPNLISTSEERRFVNLKHVLLQRVDKLNDYADFIIQNSNPSFSIENNMTYMHLNPERDLNIAGKNINTQNK